MIYMGILLYVCDNLGVKLVKCLKMLGCKLKSFGKIGDLMVVSMKSMKMDSKMKKKEIYSGMMVCLKKKMKSMDGFYMSFGKNFMVLLNSKGYLLGNSIFGLVSKELCLKKNMKLVFLCMKML